MTKYLNGGSFSVAAPFNDNYAKNYEDIFGLRRREGDCPNCDGHGRVGCVECLSCEGTGRAAYAPKSETKVPEFDTGDSG